MLFMVFGFMASAHAQGQFYVSPSQKSVPKNIPNAVPQVPDSGQLKNQLKNQGQDQVKGYARDSLSKDVEPRTDLPYVSPALRQEGPRSGADAFKQALERSQMQKLEQDQNTLGLIDQAAKVPQAKVLSNAQEPANTQELLSIATARRSGAMARVMTGSL